TASTQGELDLTRSLGADITINYTTQDFEEVVLEETGGKGVELILECVGGPVLEKSVRCIASYGRLISYGNASGTPSSLSASDITSANRTVIGFSIGRSPAGTLDHKAAMAELFPMIADGKVVGWFQGRLEFGPRALGSRSLLADARSNKMKDVINAKVKFREAFRPFAPAVLKEHAHEYFEMPEGMDAPYMLLVPKVRPEKREVIPATTHEDGTGRVQTVTEQQNGRYYRLIKRFGELTGVPVVINTSFNVRGEPIVCTPRDAYNTFVKTGIDVLVIGDYVVTQKAGDVDYDAGMRRSVALESESVVKSGVATQ
ncbi:MAG: zinc-binding dehydrogenase, partial [Planctomycetes bacterium]|nr:zinc-binding dehydrogenase [Planctomycetota bacterium]